ncbi:MAG: thioredoxin [Schaedlerella sp.]|nr:thioredoxin [Schaedlerella sp.]
MAELKITSKNFEEEVLNSKIPVLLDFWATWCGPCMMLSPIIEEIAKEYEGRVKVGKINVDEEGALAVKYRVASIPTLMLFKDGTVEKVLVGYHTKEQIADIL